MARLFFTGAEESDPLALFDNVSVKSTAANVATLLAFGNTDMTNFAPRTGRGIFTLDSTQYLQNNFGGITSKTELYVGFAMRVPACTPSWDFFAFFTDDPGVYTEKLHYRLNSDGSFVALRSTVVLATSASGVIAPNTWHYIEIWGKPLNSGGRTTVKVDGVQILDYTGDTTNDKEYINAYRWSGIEQGGSRPATAFDDIVVNDASGTENNSWPGMVRLLPMRPHLPGTYSEWTRAGINFGNDAIQARNGSFEFTMMQTTQTDKKETFNPEVPDIPAGSIIKNILITARARVEAGAGVIAPMLISNSTENISADQTLLSNWKYHQYAWYHNLNDSADWEEADLASLEIGYSS